MFYVLKVWPRSYLSVVVFQNKLSNVIVGSFIIHLTEQTTSYFVNHHFQKMALCMISPMGKLGPWWNGKFLQKILHLILHSLIVRISKWGQHFIILWSQLLKDCFVKCTSQVGICKLDIGLQHRSGRGKHQYHHQHDQNCHHHHHDQHNLYCLINIVVAN